VIPADNDGGGGGRQAGQGLNAELEGLIGRPQRVEYVAGVQDEVWFRVFGDIEQAAERGPLVAEPVMASQARAEVPV
jgi:hypothetical protein